jgi:hypothetical protein
MSIEHNSEIKFKVALDENKIPEEIFWTVFCLLQEPKAMVKSFFPSGTTFFIVLQEMIRKSIVEK